MVQDCLYIVIPAYNEQDNIQAVAKEWHEIVQQVGATSRLVIINDGSRDQTLAKLQALAQQLPQLLVLDKPNGGHGDTVLFGYHYAVAHHADYIFQTDSDGQTLPSEFMPFWQQRRQFDAQFGFRKVRQDGLARWIVTKVLRLVVLAQFHVWVVDANTPYRLMSASSLAPLLAKIPDKYNLPNVLLSVMYVKKQLKYRFTRVTFRPRQGGVNSINLKSIIKIGEHAVHDFSGFQHTLLK
ncbi:glycosyltransferase family 2 protein [Loigolactobacillus bifermentans]|uniref:Glycosyltransferase n=1 Tax=Loigolactobacillus bifermentans DSM 20003 TaxID=1423726 RepID=A0A0R1GXN9_9LACO|nr:glycosyltransferase family 2 protein [Loigolactobacillus bifermentans]KRK39131.1 glycosyltransferase [Loigolactobacillus bifermentans DSM 20003]QGG58986.1 glycosyltransferase [Loigolactobacillus bifermentans]